MNKKILIVDDEKEIVDLLEVYLSNDGYSAKYGLLFWYNKSIKIEARIFCDTA